MGLSPWQSVCLVLLGAILAVWLDEGNNQRLADLVRQEQEASCASISNQQQQVQHQNQLSPKVVAAVDENLATTAQAKWNQTVAASRGKPLNYLRDPQGFIARFQDCSIDPHCHVMYHHVSKTGGR